MCLKGVCDPQLSLGCYLGWFPKKEKKKKKRAPAAVEGLGGSGILLSHDVKVFLGTSSVGHYNQ